MATTMEQRAKFRELRTSGISRDEAQKQAYGNITPVVSPTPAPDVNSDANRLARLQASGGSPTAIANLQKTTTPTAPTTPSPVVPTAEVTDGQKFTQAPVDPTTGLSKPLAPATVDPAPTAEVKPVATVTPKTPVKTEPTVDYTQAQGREQEIIMNLEKFKTQNMTPEQIKNASGYAQATPEKKAIIDGFLNPVKQDSGTIFNTLKMGGSVPASNTTEYRQAQARYNTFRKYTTYDVASLSTAMQGGDLLMGTQAYNDLTSDPTMLAKLQRARAFTNGEVDIVKTGEKMGAYVMSNNPTVAQALSDGSMSQEEYNALTNNAEVETQAKVVSEKKAEYDEYKRQLENISDEVDKEFEGKEVTDSFKSAIKANRDKAIRRLFNSASDEYQNASGLYTELKNSSTQLLALNMEQYKTEQAQQAQIAQEERQMQNQLNLGQAQFDQKLAQQTQMMNDPATAIQSVMSEFAGMGITSQQSLQTKIADAQKFVANGGTLAGYVDKMRQDYMAKPQYKAMQEAEMNKYAPKATESWTKLDDTTLYNQITGETKKVSAGVASGYPSSFSGDTTSYIASKEGFRAEAYDDATGKVLKPGDILVGVPTIGYGTTKINGKPIQPGQTITQADAQAQLGADIAKHSTWKTIIDEKTLSDSQKTALASFEYNLGPGIWNKSAMNIIDMVKSGDLQGAGKEMQKYVNAGGKVIKGLQNRRAEEAQLLQSTQGTGTQGTGSLKNLATFMKDNQDRGTGYSNDDVKAFNEKIDRMASSGDDKGMAIAYRNMVMKDKDFKKEFDDTKSFTTALDTVQKLVDDYEKAGKSTTKLNAIAETVGRKLGMTTDTALAQLQTQMGTTMANYIKSISGTAASDAEVQRLMGNMANIGNVKNLNTAIISQVKNNALNGIKSMIDTRMYGMPEELKPQVFGDVYGSPTVSNSKLSALSQILAKIAQNAPKQ